jgi:PAS domain S-box-containing protein
VSATAQIDERLIELVDFFENAPIGFQLLDGEGVIRLANRADLRIAGFEDNPDSYVGRHISEFHSDPGAEGELLEAWTEARPVLNLRTELRRRDGSTQQVVIHSSPRHIDGKLAGACCIAFSEPPLAADEPNNTLPVSDWLEGLSDQDRADLVDVLSETFENAPVALHLVGPDGLVRRANRRELENLGYLDEPEAYIGHHIAEFHAEQAVIDEMLERLVGGMSLIHYRATLKRRDGETEPVVIYSSPRFADGAFVNTRCFTFSKSVDTLAEPANFHWPRNELEPALASGPDDITVALKRLAGRRQAEETLGLLAEASRALASEEYQDGAQTVCRLAVPFLADWASVELGGRPIALMSSNAVTGSDELIRASVLAGATRDGVSYAARLPFVTREGTEGEVLLVRSVRRTQFGPADLALADQLTLRIAVAVEAGQLRERRTETRGQEVG